MNLTSHRSWITPLVIGAFLLLAVTGVLMFFHLHRGLNKLAHEWLSWAMIFGVVLHVLLNASAFKRYFSQKIGRAVIISFVALLALSFFKLDKKETEPSYAAPIHLLSAVPLSSLAQMAGVSIEEVKHRLEINGHKVSESQQTIAEIVGNDLKKQISTLKYVIEPMSL